MDINNLDDHLDEEADDAVPVEDLRIPANVRKALFGWSRSVRKIEEDYNATLNKTGYRVGISGAILGVVGFVYGALANSQPPEIRYAVIDNYTNRIAMTLSAKDAPEAFGDGVKKSCLAEYIKLRESYHWQTDSADYHSVAIRTAPAEQLRYDDERNKANFGDRYGKDGYAAVTRFFPEHGYIRRSVGVDKIEEWDVEFIKAEVLAHDTIPHETKETARIDLRFLPDAPMKDIDRLDNRCGTYVLTYNVTEDK